ncbi:MAG: DUF6691 family protein [Cyanobacteria bacterium J06621_3]
MKKTSKENLLALVAGIVFGLGLGLSQMIDRQRVLGFLDLAGIWDPTLLFVLGGAVGVTAIAFRFVLRQSAPLLASKFRLPTRKDVDWQLVTGAAIFGIGWGVSGYCPGPGLTALVIGSWNPALFLVSMIVGMVAFNRYAAKA